MKNLYKHLFGILAVCCLTLQAQQTPAPEQTKAVTIVGATAHIGNGEVIDNALIIFENGKIITCTDATRTKMPYKGTIIQAEGKHVYPGFIAPNSTLGLQEIGSVRATNDTQEIGIFNPNIRSLIAYNSESKIIESMRPNGVLIAQITPRGGRISGTSSITQLDAWNWEDAAIKADEGIHMNWPNSFRRGRWWMGEDPTMKPNKNYSKQIAEATDFFNNSKAYLNGKKETENLKFSAMKGLFDGSKTLYIHVNDEKGITDAIAFTKNNNVKKMVIVGGAQAYKIPNLLKANNIPVLVQRVHLRPSNEDDDYDLAYKMAKILAENGVLVGLEPSGQMERMNTRNLPFYAGTVAAQGLDKEEALKLITSNTAKILGIDKQLGTLEVGKDATLFISEGDALDMRGNVLTRAFINGRDISLESHQTKLAKRYSDKYKR